MPINTRSFAMRTHWITSVAVAALTLTSSGIVRADHHAKEAEACAKMCAECQVVCDQTFHHCVMMVEGGKKEHVKAMHLTVDCAEFCALSAKITARQSGLCAAACEACAKACDACAAECAKSPDMPEMKACAAKCVECAKSCREMAKMVGHDHEKK
jgi:hypothetical protein